LAETFRPDADIAPVFDALCLLAKSLFTITTSTVESMSVLNLGIKVGYLNFLTILRANLTTNMMMARIRKSHINQIVTLNMRPTKKRPRKTMINVSKIPMGG